MTGGGHCEERKQRSKLGACPEHHEILRYAQNDTKRRTRNDKGWSLRGAKGSQ